MDRDPNSRNVAIRKSARRTRGLEIPANVASLVGIRIGLPCVCVPRLASSVPAPVARRLVRDAAAMAHNSQALPALHALAVAAGPRTGAAAWSPVLHEDRAAALPLPPPLRAPCPLWFRSDPIVGQAARLEHCVHVALADPCRAGFSLAYHGLALAHTLGELCLCELRVRCSAPRALLCNLPVAPTARSRGHKLTGVKGSPAPICPPRRRSEPTESAEPVAAAHRHWRDGQVGHVLAQQALAPHGHAHDEHGGARGLH
jgi:hypothetical protein